MAVHRGPARRRGASPRASRRALRSNIAPGRPTSQAFALEQLLYTNPLAAPIWLAGLDRAVSPRRACAICGSFPSRIAVVFLIARCVWREGLLHRRHSMRRCWRSARSRSRGPHAYVRSALFALVLRCRRSRGDAALAPRSPRRRPRRIHQAARHDRPRRHAAASYAAGLRRGVRLAAAGARRRRGVLFAPAGSCARVPRFTPTRTATPARSISSARATVCRPRSPARTTTILWGTRGYDGRTLIAIGATRIDLLRRYYRSVVLVRTSTEPYKWIVEGPAPIYLCRDPIAPLPVIWPHLRWYGA